MTGARRRVWALAVAIALVPPARGCAPALDVRLDENWPADDANQIRRAAEDWNAITNASHKISFDGSSWYVARQDPGSGWAGLTEHKKRLISIKPDLGQFTYRVAKHEFGHMLGLRHLCGGKNTQGEVVTGAGDCTDAALGVMDPIHGQVEFTPADMAECAAAGAC